MLVAPAQRQEDHVHEVREGSVHVAHVAVVDVALRDGPRDVLEDALVASERRQRRANGGGAHPRERRKRDEQRGHEEAKSRHEGPEPLTQRFFEAAHRGANYTGFQTRYVKMRAEARSMHDFAPTA